jgi:hypothetical protein
MEKTVSEIFDDYIKKNYPNVKPIPIKNQIYGQNSLDEVLKSLILQQYKQSGYYR